MSERGEPEVSTLPEGREPYTEVAHAHKVYEA